MAISDLIPIVSAVIGQAALGFLIFIASFELGKIDRLIIFYHKCLTVPMFTDLSLTPGCHTLRGLGKDPTNCLLSESAHLMGRFILQEGSEMPIVEMRHILINMHFLYAGKIEASGDEKCPISKLKKKRGFSSYVILHSLCCF